MNKTTVIHHSADYDGLFCREIARKFLPEAELIGWDFADAPIPVPEGTVYVMDLPLDKPFGWPMPLIHVPHGNLVWIDHHKSAIESHPMDLPGYRIDGVAACRLAWQWFSMRMHEIRNIGAMVVHPNEEDFITRKVQEPLAVRLAGEYDIWDHRGDGDLELQFGLRVEGDKIAWDMLLSTNTGYTEQLIKQGAIAKRYSEKVDADLVRFRSFKIKWEGLTFLCLNTGRFNSLTFDALDHPVTGHDALLGFSYNGKDWVVSLYHAKHRKDLDLSLIAVKHGGGGHRGACGFRTETLFFLS